MTAGDVRIPRGEWLANPTRETQAATRFNMSCQSHFTRCALALALWLLTAHPVPAPIHELPEKKAATSKPTSRTTEKSSAKSSTKAQPPAAKPAPQPATPVTRSRFAGTWVGTTPTVPWGNIPIVLTIDPKDTTVAMSWNGEKSRSAKAQVSGDTLQARFPAGLTQITWSITPQPDGSTARVRMQAFMNDFTSVFHRTVTQSGAAKPAN